MFEVNKRLSDIGKFESMLKVLWGQKDRLNEEIEAVDREIRTALNTFPIDNAKLGVLRLNCIELEEVVAEIISHILLLKQEQAKIIEKVV